MSLIIILIVEMKTRNFIDKSNSFGHFWPLPHSTGCIGDQRAGHVDWRGDDVLLILGPKNVSYYYIGCGNEGQNHWLHVGGGMGGGTQRKNSDMSCHAGQIPNTKNNSNKAWHVLQCYRGP